MISIGCLKSSLDRLSSSRAQESVGIEQWCRHDNIGAIVTTSRMMKPVYLALFLTGEVDK